MEENKENVQMDEKARGNKSGKIKRNVTIIVVALCLCAAVYLNWSYKNQGGSDSVLSNAELAAKTNEEMPAGSVDDDYVSEYFAQARLTRQESRDNALALLQSAAASNEASQETIEGVMNAISAMATYSMQETQIENMLLAKNFEDCVVFMSAEGIIVAVPASEEGLSADQVAQITDAIISETSYTATQLRIIPVKKPSQPPAEADEAGEAAEEGEENPAIAPIGDGSEAGAPVMDEDIATQGGYLEGETYIFE